MIFQHTWRQVLAGEKTQTRRLVKLPQIGHRRDGDWLYDHFGIEPPSVYTCTPETYKKSPCFPKATRKWQVSKDYAVQPGRGQKQVGRIRITAIRQERLQAISEEDAIAEGCEAAWCPQCDGSAYRTGTGMMVDPNNPYGEPLPTPIQVPCDYCQGAGAMASPREVYAKLWQSIHTKPGTRWEDDPLVWVLCFELVQDARIEQEIISHESN